MRVLWVLVISVCVGVSVSDYVDRNDVYQGSEQDPGAEDGPNEGFEIFTTQPDMMGYADADKVGGVGGGNGSGEGGDMKGGKGGGMGGGVGGGEAGGVKGGVKGGEGGDMGGSKAGGKAGDMGVGEVGGKGGGDKAVGTMGGGNGSRKTSDGKGGGSGDMGVGSDDMGVGSGDMGVESDGMEGDKNGDKNAIGQLKAKWGRMFDYYDLNMDGEVNKSDFKFMEDVLEVSETFKVDAKKVARLSSRIAVMAEKDLTRIKPATDRMTKNATVKIMQLQMQEGRLQVSAYRNALYDILSPFGELIRKTFVEFERALYRMDEVTANRAFDAIAGSGRASVLKMHYVAAYHRYFTDPSADVDRFPLHGMERGMPTRESYTRSSHSSDSSHSSNDGSSYDSSSSQNSEQRIITTSTVYN